jgi:hypothetical protein
MTHLIFAEENVRLNSVELEILLTDVHGHLAGILTYLENGQKHSLIPENWVRLRMATFKNLAAKLELALMQIETKNEEKTNEKGSTSP